jgi:hypothetical protein
MAHISDGVAAAAMMQINLVGFPTGAGPVAEVCPRRRRTWRAL